MIALGDLQGRLEPDFSLLFKAQYGAACQHLHLGFFGLAALSLSTEQASGKQSIIENRAKALQFMSNTTTSPSTALVRSAYEHCSRIAIGMLTSQGELSPQLFLVGLPSQGDDAATSKIARVGTSAMTTFHASQASADQLIPFILRTLDQDSEEGKALRRQIGPCKVAVHACHALVSEDTPLLYPNHGQPSVRSDGRRECILITTHTAAQNVVVHCPIYRDAGGALQSNSVPWPIYGSI